MSVVRALLRSPSGLVGTVLVGVLLGTALLSLFWTPYDPTLVDPRASWVPAFSGDHWLGTDTAGKDILSQLIAGSRITVLVAVLASLIAVLLGVALAILTAVPPRWISESLAHVLDVLIAFPVLLLAMVFAAVFGGSTWTGVTAVGLGLAVIVARVTRAEIMRVMAADYVLAARASGAGIGRIVGRHVLPNVAPTLVVQASLALAIAVLAEAALSYLGYGTPPPTPSWGRLLHEQQPYLTVRPLLVVWPGLVIALTVLGFNLLGDGLRDAIDPQLRRDRTVG
ncbi:ABC transporter permease [Cryptosporangium aurantiacum]|uniref:Peptide/nickel transport system permease protein n=1 Tax=Cryptosporangium aurantiacum TaxID=134849 RepID=A0A1M7K9Q4_9ACTN|nr:ABC transporter permease [Cryptosporangium aurantiacum]SHM61996.1 peptide/nickel transport system permease protein [Cryptosporangium aurantiacum]